jgi:hypothetical protein
MADLLAGAARSEIQARYRPAVPYGAGDGVAQEWTDGCQLESPKGSDDSVSIPEARPC